MRELQAFELTRVGGGCSPTPTTCECPDDDKGKKRKGGKQGNNGFGNGGNDGVPGNSGNNPAPNAGQKRRDRVR